MNFMDMIRKSGKTQDEIANELRCSQQAVSSWATGGSSPRLTKIKELSRFLGVPELDIINCFDKQNDA